jgi:ABC-type lipoprotein export system ATPase subunit/FtsP/CotA-like multicopper oxidase with cupredoxin domain
MISLLNVTKEYRLDETTSITPINRVNLEIKSGEFLMIVGRSGSGKTTLLNLCAGLIKPTSGQVLIDGVDLQNMSDEKLSDLRSRKIGFIFQFQSMLPNLTVIENVAMPAAAYKNMKDDVFKRGAELLEMVGLKDRMNALPKQLSAGELRRVAIARALMNRPEVLLADEPTSDLDEQTEVNIVSLLQSIHQSGVSIMMITHNMDLVPYATRAFKVEDGGLVPVNMEEYRARRATPVAGHIETDRERELVLTHSSGESGRNSARSIRRRRAIFMAPGGAMWLGVTAVVLAAFAVGTVLPGAIKPQPSASTAETQSATNQTAARTNAMGMGGASGTAQYDPTEYNLYGNTGMYSNAMMGVTWPLRNDPAPGAPFQDPPLLQNLSNTPGVFEGKLEAREANISLSGTMASLLTYNGLYPGPLIKVKHGDILKIDFVNSLPATTAKNVLGFEENHTNLHTHGLHVSMEEPSDDDMLDIAPGQSYNYQFDLSKQDGGTLNFIHGHSHGTAAEQLWGGMLATVLVEDEITALSSYETHVMVLKDITLDGSEPQAHLFMTDWMYGKEGNIVTVNGQVNPVMSIKPGQVQRWQILNGSNARFYKIYLENHLLYLVGTDSGLLDKPYPVSSLLLAPGERADVLVKAGTGTGSYKLVSLPYSRMMGMMGIDAGMSGMSMPMQNGNSTSWYEPGMGMYGSSDNLTMGPYGMGMNGGMYNPYGYSSSSMYGGMSMYGANMYGGIGMQGQGGMYDPYPYATWPTVTKLLGLTTAEIQAQLAQGLSLVDIAASRNITADQVVQAILDQTKANLEEYVKDGYLNEEQVSQQLIWLEPYVRQAISAKTAGGPGMYDGMYNSNLPYGSMGMYGSMNNSSLYDPSQMYGGVNNGSCGGTSMYGMGTVGWCPGMIGTIGMGTYDMSASVQVTLMTLACSGVAVSQDLPTIVNPAATRLAMDISSLPVQTLILSMDMTGNAYINGQDFDMQPLIIKSQAGTFEVWQIINRSMMDHPFHLHTNPFQVLTIMGGDIDYSRLYTSIPAMKDTIIVPKCGSVTILVPIKDFSGTDMFHCHILEHEDIGMMGIWQIGDTGMQPMKMD